MTKYMEGTFALFFERKGEEHRAELAYVGLGNSAAYW
jgi:hypothetical protein